MAKRATHGAGRGINLSQVEATARAVADEEEEQTMDGMVPEVFGCRLRSNLLFKAYRYNGEDFENERFLIEDRFLLDHEDEGFHSWVMPGDVVVYAEWMKPVQVFSEHDFKMLFEEAQGPGGGVFTVKERVGPVSSADGSHAGDPTSYVCVEHEEDSVRLTWPDWPHDLPEGFCGHHVRAGVLRRVGGAGGIVTPDEQRKAQGGALRPWSGLFKHPGSAAGEDEPFGGASQGVVPRFRLLGGCGLMSRGASAVWLRRIDICALDVLDRDGRILVHDAGGIFLVCETTSGGKERLAWCGLAVEHNTTAPAGEGSCR